MTGVILVTHAGLGESLMHQAEIILGQTPTLALISISYGADPDIALTEMKEALTLSNDAGGVVLLTDLPGATPHNIALKAASEWAAPVVSGLNLPMLLKVITHRDRPANELAALAGLGGHQGITNA